MRLYLASTSPARLATLRAAGIEPILLSSGVDEEAAVAAAGPLTPEEMVLLLARLKAEAVIGRLVDGEPIDGFILGGDSAFELDGAVYGKPHLPDVARERWLAQRGREGSLHSGHWLIDHRAGSATGSVGGVSSAQVRFAASISDEEIDAYIATGEPLEVAGARARTPARLRRRMALSLESPVVGINRRIAAFLSDRTKRSGADAP